MNQQARHKPSENSGKKDKLFKTLTGFELAEKVNIIERLGKWIFAGFHDGRVCMYDVGIPEQVPMEEISRKGTVRGILVENESIYLLYRKAEEKTSSKQKNLVSLYSWNPHLKKEEAKEFIILSKYRFRVSFYLYRKFFSNLSFFLQLDQK